MFLATGTRTISTCLRAVKLSAASSRSMQLRLARLGYGRLCSAITRIERRRTAMPRPATPPWHRADFEHERERADQLVTAQDRMVAELEALHSLLEAAQQAAPPVTSRPPDMARHDMARDDSLAQSMRSLLEAAQAARLEAAQQAAPPVTSRTWREMTWSERWRRLRRTG